MLAFGTCPACSVPLYRQLTTARQQINFTQVVMTGVLAFLLFAGALNVDVPMLRQRALPVASLALVGTVISTFSVGCALWTIGRILGYPLPLECALVFGA